MDRENFSLLTELYQGVLFPELAGRALDLHTTGLLPSQHIEQLIAAGRIIASESIEPGQLQPASLDLRLGNIAYRVRASFLPGERSSVMAKVRDLTMRELDLTQPCVLEKDAVYIVPLMEQLRLPNDISGKANPKSTTGRLDIFTRLITDYCSEFERIKAGYRGNLYVEIVPRSFSVMVRQGTKLNQLRLMKGNPISADSALDALHSEETLVFDKDEMPADATIEQGLWIGIDLVGSDESDIVGYRAKPQTPILDLERLSYYDPADYWEPIHRPRSRSLILNPNDFYILASTEKIRIPSSHAAAMVPYDPSVGEFRIHYAGFFDPGFGYGTNDIKGTRAVLEVRSHEVPFLLEHGQIVGRLIYERLLAVPSKVYGKDLGSSYQSQGIALSKQFKQLGTA
jgi:dCTP deaminase